MSRTKVFGTMMLPSRPGGITFAHHFWIYTAICDSCDLFVSGPMPDLIDVADQHARGCHVNGPAEMVGAR